MNDLSKIITLDSKQELYNKLVKEKENGKKFKKEDLTSDILYKLSIEEKVADSLIGNIFDLTRSQVKYLRSKYDLGNKFIKSLIDNCEENIQKIKKILPNFKDLSEEEIFPIYIESLKSYCKIKKYNLDKFNRYLNLKFNFENFDLDKNNFEYEVNYVNKKHIGQKNKTNKVSNGHKINQYKTTKNKIDSGKLGEKIVYKSEVKKLKKLGINKKVEWISKNYDDISFDGTGYDIISYNEKGEKIYIEVKCSINNTTDNVTFNISNKEIEFMKGKLRNIDKNHCFIYYVSNINSNLFTADIFIINSETFLKYKLTPINYSVNEIYENI